MNNLIKAIFNFLATVIVWQGMNEIYKFEKADLFLGFYLIAMGFVLFLFLFLYGSRDLFKPK